MCFSFCIIDEQQCPTIHPLTSRKTSSIDSYHQSIVTKGGKTKKHGTIRQKIVNKAILQKKVSEKSRNLTG